VSAQALIVAMFGGVGHALGPVIVRWSWCR